MVDWDNWENDSPKIFMDLKDGTLKSLVLVGTHPPNIAETDFYHMLQVLNYLTDKGIIHRDVKPENILYVLKNRHYQVQLGDLGLSNEARMAVTRAGTPIYMAPELTLGTLFFYPFFRLMPILPGRNQRLTKSRCTAD